MRYVIVVAQGHVSLNQRALLWTVDCFVAPLEAVVSRWLETWVWTFVLGSEHTQVWCVCFLVSVSP